MTTPDPSLEALPDELKQLFDAERAERSLSDAELEAVFGRIDRSLVALTATLPSARPSLPWSVVGAFVAGVVAHATFQAALPYVWPSTKPSAVATQPAPSATLPAPSTTQPDEKVPEVPAAAEPTPPAAPETQPSPRPKALNPVSSPARAVGQPAVSVPVASDTTLEREQILLNTARSALARQRPDDARKALEQHQREAPQGALSEERDFLWLQILVSTQQYAEASERMAAFERTWPQSLYGPALAALREKSDAGQ